MMSGKLLVGFLVLFCFIASLNTLEGKNRKKEVKKMELKVTSGAFTEGGSIPSRYSCDGNDISPPLSWTAGPAGLKSYAIIADDPDAPMGTWVHWVIYNIPASVNSLPENLPKEKKLADGTLQGVNDFKRHGYGGPCPPGGTHRYFFKVYALDTVLKADSGLSKKKLIKAMEGHVIGQGELMGTYSR
jgi:Raf kinase inhibitor-like YbhB/YbcL family protein